MAIYANSARDPEVPDIPDQHDGASQCVGRLYAIATSWLVWIACGLSHEVAAACSRGRQPAVPVESSGKSHEVATASVVVACYRHFVANQCWAIRYRGLTPTAICYRHFVASLDRLWT